MVPRQTKPPPRLLRNLQILVFTRSAYFTHNGLPPFLLSTLFWFITESNRIPLTRLILPIIHDNNNRRILMTAISQQSDQWLAAKPFEPAWTFFRRAGIFPTKQQQLDDLLQVDYATLLDDIKIPDNANLGRFWGGLTDFLTNQWSLLEEFRQIPAIKTKMEESDRLASSRQSTRVTKIIGWFDMQLEHHLLNIMVRLRAGWDKLADYVLTQYFGVTNMGKKWPKRLDKLDKTLRTLLNSQQMKFWDDVLVNARAIAQEDGLRDLRDFELHKIALRARETLGDRGRAHSLEQLESFAIREHYRLQDSFLLSLGMIRSSPLPNP